MRRHKRPCLKTICLVSASIVYMMSDCEQPIGNNSILEAEVVMSPLRSGSLPNFFRLEL